jgi:hypothetical protein
MVSSIRLTDHGACLQEKEYTAGRLWETPQKPTGSPAVRRKP